MKFRPCIDLHDGIVKQVVGSTISENPADLKTNFKATEDSAYFAELYKKDGLTGGHIIQLGKNKNIAAAERALQAYRSGMQLGGGVDIHNAPAWLDAGASHVIITSAVFKDGKINWEMLKIITKMIGKENLVLDLSCKKKEDGKYYVVTDLWTKFTDFEVTAESLETLKDYADEFLIHAVDVEGQSLGVDQEVLQIMGGWAGLPMTYAGGIHNWEDIKLIQEAGKGAIDFTVGSALDLFGGTGIQYTELVEQNKAGFICLP